MAKIKIKRTSDPAAFNAVQLEAGEFAMLSYINPITSTLITKVSIGTESGAKAFVGGDDKMNTVAGAPANNILTLDADGQAQDSGKKFNDTGTTVNDILSANEVISKINALPMGSSSGANFFLSDANSGSFKTLSRTAPNGSQAIATTSVSSTTPVLLKQFMSAPLGITSLDSDLWTFNLFASCDVTQDTSNITIRVSKSDDILGTNTTELFTASNGDINSLVAVPVLIEKTESSYSFLETDCLLVEILASTTHNSPVNVSLYYNDTDTNSHIHTPIKATHNQLQGLQGGSTTERYHLNYQFPFEPEMLRTI